MEHAEEAKQCTAEAERNISIMTRFTTKVREIVQQAYEAEATRTQHIVKRSPEFWRLYHAIRDYNKSSSTTATRTYTANSHSRNTAAAFVSSLLT